MRAHAIEKRYASMPKSFINQMSSCMTSIVKLVHMIPFISPCKFCYIILSVYDTVWKCITCYQILSQLHCTSPANEIRIVRVEVQDQSNWIYRNTSKRWYSSAAISPVVFPWIFPVKHITSQLWISDHQNEDKKDQVRLN